MRERVREREREMEKLIKPIHQGDGSETTTDGNSQTDKAGAKILPISIFR
jgi:hypothetical protein